MTFAKYLKLIVENPTKSSGQKYLEIVKAINQACELEDKKEKLKDKGTKK